MTLSPLELKRAQIRREMIDDGRNPDAYEIIFRDEDPDDYEIRRLGEDEMAHRRREHLAIAEEFLTKALREFGYGTDDILEMDTVEMAETFGEEMAELRGESR
jgi:hypothetical protein